MAVKKTIPGDVNKPTFESGGVQNSAIRNITGNTTSLSGNNGARLLVTYTATGTFQTEFTSGTQLVHNTPYSVNNYFSRDNLDVSRAVPTAPDVRGENLSEIYWRRVS